MPDEVSSQTRRYNLVIPSGVDRCLIVIHSELFKDNRLVESLLGSSMVRDPLNSPGLWIAGLAPGYLGGKGNDEQQNGELEGYKTGLRDKPGSRKLDFQA